MPAVVWKSAPAVAVPSSVVKFTVTCWELAPESVTVNTRFCEPLSPSTSIGTVDRCQPWRRDGDRRAAE